MNTSEECGGVEVFGLLWRCGSKCESVAMDRDGWPVRGVRHDW